jgi:hypothetical protein
MCPPIRSKYCITSYAVNCGKAVMMTRTTRARSSGGSLSIVLHSAWPHTLVASAIARRSAAVTGSFSTVATLVPGSGGFWLVMRFSS